MSKPITYEATIARKLDELSSPQLIDAIWDRVERQLDIDMPEDGSIDEEKGPSGGPDWTGWTGMFIFVGALVAAFFYLSPGHQPVPSTAPRQQPREQSPRIPGSSDSTQRIGREELEKKNTVPFNPDPRARRIDSTKQFIEDSTAQSAPLTKKMDSVIATPSIVLPEKIDSARDVPKRRRGVTVNDSDYSVVPKRPPGR